MPGNQFTYEWTVPNIGQHDQRRRCIHQSSGRGHNRESKVSMKPRSSFQQTTSRGYVQFNVTPGSGWEKCLLPFTLPPDRPLRGGSGILFRRHVCGETRKPHWSRSRGLPFLSTDTMRVALTSTLPDTARFSAIYVDLHPTTRRPRCRSLFLKQESFAPGGVIPMSYSQLIMKACVVLTLSRPITQRGRGNRLRKISRHGA